MPTGPTSSRGRAGLAVAAAAAGTVLAVAGCSSASSTSASPAPGSSTPGGATGGASPTAPAGSAVSPSASSAPSGPAAGALPTTSQTPLPAAAGQLTGTQLESILLPASDFPAGYTQSQGSPVSSGGSLTTSPATYNLATVSCSTFVQHLGSTGFGETATASGSVASAGKAFDEVVYQFATPAKASAFVAGIQSVAGRCASFKVTSGGTTGTFTLAAAAGAPVGGHASVRVTETGNLQGKKVELDLLLSASGVGVFGGGAVGAGTPAPTTPDTATVVYNLMKRQAAAALLG